MRWPHLMGLWGDSLPLWRSLFAMAQM
jgi:hypothetical protein